MSTLSADDVWLDFLDNDYLQSHPRTTDKQEIWDALSQVLKERQPRTVLSPLDCITPTIWP